MGNYFALPAFHSLKRVLLLPLPFRHQVEEFDGANRCVRQSRRCRVHDRTHVRAGACSAPGSNKLERDRARER